MLTALVLGTAASLAPPLLAKVAIDEGIERHDTHTLVLVVVAFLALGAARVGDDLRADLSRRLGRPARARGPAHPHLHPPAEPADRLLREPPGGRVDLAHDQRRGGAGKPRDRLGRDAVPGRPHARRGGRGAAVPRREAGPADVLRRPVRGRRLDLVSARLGRRVPAHAGDDRRDHRLPAGDPLGHPRRAQLRPGAPPRGAVRGAQHGQLRREHGHGAAQRRLLPDGGNALRRRARADRPVRRLPGAGRPHHRGHRRRVRGDAVVPVRTDPAALPALHDLPVGDGGAREDLPVAGRHADPDRSRGGDPAGAHPRRSPLRGRLVRLHKKTRWCSSTST